MKTVRHNTDSPKKATNLSINSELLRQAREYKINLSQTLEQCLIETLREKKRQQWLQENADAIKHYNHRLATHGVFSDKLRKF